MTQEIIQFFSSLNFNWSIIESLAVFFSLLYVILAAQENIWCWGAALISVSLYTYICYTAKVFPETGLQIFYLIMAIIGYLTWNKKSKEKIKEWSEFKHLIIITLGALFSFIMGFYFFTYTDSVMPIIDSFTTVFSIIATYMVVKKVLGNWLYWIVIDLLSVYMYFHRDLHLTSLLFVAYTTIAVYGYASWCKRIKKNE